MQKDYVLFCRVCGEIYTGFFRDSLYIEGKLISAYQLYKYEGNWYFISDAHKIARSTRVYLGEQYVTGKTYDGVRPMQPGYYEFDENGYMVIPEMKNGVIDGYLYINDVKQTAYKLVAFDGSYYFISDYNKVVVDCKVYLNAQFLVGTEYEGHVGYYEFDADGKLVKAPEWKEGEINGYLYIDNVMQTAYQLVEYDGNIYFISDAHKIAKSCRLFLGAGFTEPMGLPAGYYEFDANGHMIRG